MASKEEEITDSTDWLPTPVPKLAPVEAALRCHVCKDFFTSPMITTCSHTFCSLCIRRCLSVSGQCPECRAPDQEMKLKPNSTVQELVDMFVAARPSLMELAKQTESVVCEPRSPKRKRKIGEGSAGQGPTKKRTSGRSTRSTPVVVDSNEDDGEYNSEADHIDDNMVACPICNEKFPTEAAVGVHLDHCGMEPSRPRTSKTIAHPVSKSLTSTRTRIAAANFDLMKEPQIRKKLTEYNLSTHGTKELMVKRWKEWTLLFNSNLDNEKDPKSDSTLRRELDLWEKTQGSRSSGMNTFQRGTQIKDKDFDIQAYSEKHDVSFKDLIANAKKRTVKKETETEEAKSAAITPPLQQIEHINNLDAIQGSNSPFDSFPETNDAFPSPGNLNPPSLESRSVWTPDIYFQEDDLKRLMEYGQPPTFNPPPLRQSYPQYASPAIHLYETPHFVSYQAPIAAPAPTPAPAPAPAYSQVLAPTQPHQNTMPTISSGPPRTYESFWQAHSKSQDDYALPPSSQAYDSSPRKGGGSGP